MWRSALLLSRVVAVVCYWDWLYESSSGLNSSLKARYYCFAAAAVEAIFCITFATVFLPTGTALYQLLDVLLQWSEENIFKNVFTFRAMCDILSEDSLWIPLSSICLPGFVVVLSGAFPWTSFVSLAILCLTFLVFNVLVGVGKILQEAIVLLLKCSHAQGLVSRKTRKVFAPEKPTLKVRS